MFECGLEDIKVIVVRRFGFKDIVDVDFLKKMDNIFCKLEDIQNFIKQDIEWYLGEKKELVFFIKKVFSKRQDVIEEVLFYFWDLR